MKNVDYLSDENEEDFDVVYKNQKVSLPSLLIVEEINDSIYRLNPTKRTNFSPCVLVDYIDDKLQTYGQTKNVKNIYQLIETWQIDENAVLEY